MVVRSFLLRGTDRLVINTMQCSGCRLWFLYFIIIFFVVTTQKWITWNIRHTYGKLNTSLYPCRMNFWGCIQINLCVHQCYTKLPNYLKVTVMVLHIKVQELRLGICDLSPRTFQAGNPTPSKLISYFQQSILVGN